jgi:hypothetical protein
VALLQWNSGIIEKNNTTSFKIMDQDAISAIIVHFISQIR